MFPVPVKVWTDRQTYRETYRTGVKHTGVYPPGLWPRYHR